MVITDTDFPLGTEHAERLNTTQLGFLDLEVVKLCTHQCERHLDARACIRGTADYLVGAGTITHRTNEKLVRVRMLADRLNLTNDHLCGLPRHRFVAIDLKPDHRQLFDKFVCR